MGWQDKLQEMVDGYDAQIAALRTQISSIESKSDDIHDQAFALTTTKFSSKGSIQEVIEAKRASFAAILSGTCTTHYGTGFGTTNLTDWYIYYHGDGPGFPLPGVLYQYGGIGWDDDKTIVCLILEFDFIDDYINVPLDEGLYGLDSMFDLLNSGIDKLNDMIDKFETAKERLESFAKTGISSCMITPSF